MKQMNIGWSNFAAKRHLPGSGNSFFTISPQEVLQRVDANWPLATPGTGETTLDRKVLVPINPQGFYTSSVQLTENMPLRAEVVRRQPHEDPYVEVFLDAGEAKRLGIQPMEAKFCNIVCYSRAALLENDGEVSGDFDWEIVAVLASLTGLEPMPPLTMARNFLEMPGGSKSVYTAQEFAEAIYAHSLRGIKIKAVREDYSGVTPEQIVQKIKELRVTEKALGWHLADIGRIRRQLQEVCPHKFDPYKANDLMSSKAHCRICDNDFGWRCPKSPDGVCHSQYEAYQQEIEGLSPEDCPTVLELIDGTEVEVPTDFNNTGEAECVFCHVYEERK
jgi:hypothetical protein